jgi:hypothetical protein
MASEKFPSITFRRSTGFQFLVQGKQAGMEHVGNVTEERNKVDKHIKRHTSTME